MVYAVSRFLAAFIIRCCFALRFEMEESLPSKGRLLVVSNHVSNFDPFIIGIILPRKLNFLAKKELFHNPIMASWLYKVKAFPLMRGRADITALKESLHRLGQEDALLVFPQGRRTSDLEKINPGVGFLAKKTAAPVFPVKIINKGKSFFRKEIIVKTGRIFHIDRTKTPEEISQNIWQRVLDL